MPFVFDFARVYPSLENAPIVEAVLQWKISPPARIDREKTLIELQERFHGYKIMHINDVQMALFPDKFQREESWQGYQLASESDGAKYVCQFKKNSLTVSQLERYHDWESFVAEARKFWIAFKELCQPQEISSLSTRFISQIPLNSIQDANQFTKFPQCTWVDGGAFIDSFFHQESVQIDNHPYAAVLVRMVPPKNVNSAKRELIIDIDIATTQSFTDDGRDSRLDHHLKHLRYLKNNIFFSVIEDPQGNFGVAEQ